jgi:hypothetical protein
MNKTVEKGLIKAGKFSEVKLRWRRSKEMALNIDGIDIIKALPDTEEYCRVLAKNIPKLRNTFAHPDNTTLLLPNQATSFIKTSSEFINQLFEIK